MTKKILLIYTGGTIGMKTNPATGALAPFDFSQIEQEVPELKKFKVILSTETFNPIMDSSNVSPEEWEHLATLIKERYNQHDGFVVLHGTDTMAYTASALSFMLENLAKPIIFTGSQIPMGVLRTDGRENLVSAIEIAAAGKVKEVCVYFQNQLMRGNRTTKQNAQHFNAFASHNYPILAQAGISINYNTPYIRQVDSFMPTLQVHSHLERSVTIIKLFPGTSERIIRSILETQSLRAVVIECYGSGNAPSEPWFLEALSQAIERGIVIYNVTQCAVGSVNMDLYDTGRAMRDIGIVGGYDITLEAAVTKLMYLLGKGYNNDQIASYLGVSLRGEITPKENVQ
ncbi:MAG: type I asparaginase [Rikenellaceae bacterium]